MKKLLSFAQFLLSLVLVQGVMAANIYVSESGTGAGTIASPTSLWTALATAKANGEDDTVFLQTGSYTHDPAFVYDATGTDTTDLTLSGGWNAGLHRAAPATRLQTRVSGENTPASPEGHRRRREGWTSSSSSRGLTAAKRQDELLHRLPPASRLRRRDPATMNLNAGSRLGNSSSKT